ncbi:MAG TPA: alkaline phosphatase [Bacteroidia bacterium]|nr:alkaline phosphatase [Bacteroidia bacterium]
MAHPSTNRRDFLRASLATSAIFGAETALTTATTRAAGANQGGAKNIVFMVSDGMNHGALSLARLFRANEGGGETHWSRLYREQPVVRALVETFSANSCVTDSAAAASAWGGGKRVNNGTLNVLPDGTPTRTLHQKFQAAGRKTGLVTTATITHATPAGFAVNFDSRGDEAQIAEQYLERQVDILLGGGRKFYSPELREKYAKADYALVESRDALLSQPVEKDKRLLGLFYDGHLPYSIDRHHVDELKQSVPTLAEMTKAALDRLSPDPNGFLLMVEGARIDHAGHANDAAASIHDQLAFDEAIGTAAEFAAQHPDTLVILTTDHGCGGIQMNGVSGKREQGFEPGIYNVSSLFFERLRGFNRSLEWMKQNGVSGLSGKPLADAIAAHTGMALTEDEIKASQGLKASFEDVIQAHTGVGWTSGNHTGELVEFCAFGPGSSEFPALMRNEDIHDKLLRIVGIGA